MSILRTHNLQNPDSSSINIVMDQGGNTNITGVTTVGSNFHVTDGISRIGALTEFGTKTVSDKGLIISSSGENTLKLIDTTSYTSNVGASILLGGQYRASGDAQEFVKLKSFKENSTNGDYAYGFSVSTNANGGVVTERLRITSSGDVGIGTDNPTANLHVFGSTDASSIIDGNAGDGLLTLRNAGNGNWSGINFTRERSTGTNVTGGSIWMPSDTANNSAILYLQTQSASANAGASGALTDNNGVRLKLASQPNGSGPNSAFTVEVGSTERLRVDANGTLLVNAAIDNTGGHGQIVAHAPTSGNTIYKAIEIGNTNGNGTARGAAICGQPKSNSHLPYTLIGSWDHGDNTDCYYGGGWGGAMRPATRHRFYTNSSYPTSGGSGTENMTLNGDGHLTLPNQPAFQVTGFPSHRYMNVWQQVDLSGWNYVTQNGSHFDNSNGRFTAPVAGKYFFIYTAMYHNPNSNDFATIIKKNGSNVTLSNNISGGGSSNGHQWNDCTIQAIVNMSANDYVTFTTVGSNSTTCYLYGNSGSTYNSASGFLIG